LRQGKGFAYIFVMLLLHYLPRFGRQKPLFTSDFRRITGKDPLSLEAFIDENRPLFDQLSNPLNGKGT